MSDARAGTAGGPHTTAVLLPPTPASYLRVGGLPLICRTVVLAQRAGFDAVVAVAGEDELPLRQALAADRRSRAVPISRGPILPVIAQGGVVVLPSDCVFTAGALRRLRDAGGDPEAVALRPDGVSGAPIVLCSRDAFGGLETALLSGTPVGAVPAERTREAAEVLAGEVCTAVAGEADAERAERRLIAALRAETYASDGPIARLDRSLSMRISRRLVHTPLRPNHITTIGTAVGLLAAWCFAQGTHGFGLLGAILFWAATIVDGCDGEVARLKLQETRFGGLYDVVTDNVVHAAIFAGLAAGQVRVNPNFDLPLLAGALVVGLLCACAATYFCLIRHPPVTDSRPRSRRGRIRRALLLAFEAVMNRDFSYLLLALAAVDRLGWFVWGAAYGTFAYCAALVWVYRWRDAE